MHDGSKDTYSFKNNGLQWVPSSFTLILNPHIDPDLKRNTKRSFGENLPRVPLYLFKKIKK